MISDNISRMEETHDSICHESTCVAIQGCCGRFGRKCTVLFLLVMSVFIGTVCAHADMRVKSFTMLEMDLDARVSAPVIDKKTNQKCPLLKIVTTADGFYFDIGAMGAPEKVVYKKDMGEVWVYLPVKTAKLKISHPKYGQISTDTKDGYYWFPNARLQAATSYRMELSVTRGEFDDEDNVKTGWMAITSEPTGAEVYISPEGEELQFVGTTPFAKKYPYGVYDYSIRKNMYHSQSGRGTLQEERISNNFVLDPAFGKVHVTSNPSGAKVTFEGSIEEYVTPFTTDNMKSGEYKLKFILNKYAPVVKPVTVRDGETTELAVDMTPNFAAITINSLEGAKISINGNVVGSSSVTQELDEGIYDIQATLEHHRAVSRQVEVAANQPQTIALNPTPIYGSIDVNSTPFDAEVTIDGKLYGKTPMTIGRILEGDYDVVISKDGYVPVTKHVSVAEKQTASIEAKLEDAKNPVQMMSKKDPLYPSWLAEMSDSGCIIGISHPTTDGNEARQMAIANSLLQYAITSGEADIRGMFVHDYESIEGDEEEKITYEDGLLLADFNFSIDKEYYNSRGEYFVAGRVAKSTEKSDTLFIKRYIESDFTKKKCNKVIIMAFVTGFGKSFINYQEETNENHNSKIELSINDKIIDTSEPMICTDNLALSNDSRRQLYYVSQDYSLGLAQFMLMGKMIAFPQEISYNKVGMESTRQTSIAIKASFFGRVLPNVVKLHSTTKKGLNYTFGNELAEVEGYEDHVYSSTNIGILSCFDNLIEALTIHSTAKISGRSQVQENTGSDNGNEMESHLMDTHKLTKISDSESRGSFYSIDVTPPTLKPDNFKVVIPKPDHSRRK